MRINRFEKCPECGHNCERENGKLIPTPKVTNVYIIEVLREKYEVKDCKTCGQRYTVLKKTDPG